MSSNRDDETPQDFLSRWSRRKVRAKTPSPDETGISQETDELRARAEPDGVSPPRHKPGRMITDAPVEEDADSNDDVSITVADSNDLERTDAELGSDEADTEPDADKAPQDWSKIDIDALGPDADFARFMGEDVPEYIRKKALHKLWSSNPLFARMDGLDDYAEDFTDAVWVVPDLKTDYKVGRGFLSDEEVAEWEALGKPEEPGADTDKTDGGDALVVTVETPDQPEVIAMLKASEACHRDLYPAESNHFTPISDLLAPNVDFLVARVNGKTAGCGALIFGNDETGELKRMWVDPKQRGNKIGRQLLTKLETLALSRNLTVLRLETGIYQQEALKLYRTGGYAECKPFGAYEEDPLSFFMEKTLQPDTAKS